MILDATTSTQVRTLTNRSMGKTPAATISGLEDANVGKTSPGQSHNVKSPNNNVWKCFVFPGVDATATFLLPTNALIVEDLPTLGKPTIPTVGRPVLDGGASDEETSLPRPPLVVDVDVDVDMDVEVVAPFFFATPSRAVIRARTRSAASSKATRISREERIRIRSSPPESSTSTRRAATASATSISTPNSTCTCVCVCVCGGGDGIVVVCGSWDRDRRNGGRESRIYHYHPTIYDDVYR